MKLLAVGALVAVLGGGYLKLRPHDADAAADTNAALACLQAGGRSAAIETSSTGQPQIALLHGSVRVSDNVTLENSKTYITFMRSPDEAAWWADQLRQAPDIPDDSVVSSGNAFVQYGAGATAADRAAVAVCLA